MAAWPDLPEAIKAGILAMVCGQRETVAFKSSDVIDVNTIAIATSHPINDSVSLHLPYGSGFPPDLAAVVDAWPELPEALKAGILAMVGSCARPRRDKRTIHTEAEKS